MGFKLMNVARGAGFMMAAAALLYGMYDIDTVGLVTRGEAKGISGIYSVDPKVFQGHEAKEE